MHADWFDRKTLQAKLSISRSAFFRRVQAGHIEKTVMGGATVYRPIRRDPSDSQSRDPSEHAESHQRDPSATGPATATDLVPAREVLDLVAKYETRIDAMLARERAQNDRERELADKAAALATAVAHEQNAAQAERHARQLQALEAQSALVTMRQRAERAERELELANTPWWQWGKRRRLMLTAGVVEGGINK